MKNTIKLEEDDTLQFEITDKDGNSTGEYLEFHMDDISLPLRYRDLIFKSRENRKNFKKDMTIINKKQDVQDKDDPMTRNELEIVKLSQQYLNKEVEIYNMFLGENGVQKLLNGNPLGWDSLNKIDKLIENQIQPVIEKHLKTMEEMIEKKYNPEKEEELI